MSIIFKPFFFWLCKVFVVAHELSLVAAYGFSWDLSPPTRDQTYVLCIGRQTLNHQTTREVPQEG